MVMCPLSGLSAHHRVTNVNFGHVGKEPGN